MLARLADLFVLRPTRHAIETDGKSRRRIPFGNGHLEVWISGQTAGEGRGGVLVLKFPGAGGRAERASDHPADVWTRLHTEVWAVNPPGYGGSAGRASLQHLAEVSQRVFDAAERSAGTRPIVVAGNSLGALGALHLAATRGVHGLLLRNPPPLRPLIMGRFGWWNLGLGARLIAEQVPQQLDTVANAARCQAPAVFVSSGRDRVVPPQFQQQVIGAYGGQKRVLHLPQADHACPLTEDQRQQYASMLHWLRQHIAAHSLDGR